MHFYTLRKNNISISIFILFLYRIDVFAGVHCYLQKLSVRSRINTNTIFVEGNYIQSYEKIYLYINLYLYKCILCIKLWFVYLLGILYRYIMCLQFYLCYLKPLKRKIQKTIH